MGTIVRHLDTVGMGTWVGHVDTAVMGTWVRYVNTVVMGTWQGHMDTVVMGTWVGHGDMGWSCGNSGHWDMGGACLPLPNLNLTFLKNLFYTISWGFMGIKCIKKAQSAMYFLVLLNNTFLGKLSVFSTSFFNVFYHNSFKFYS